MNYTILKLIVRRVVTGLISLFAISVLVFSMVDFLPGDFASSILGMSATEESKAAFEKELGLDEPPVQRYVAWLGGVVSGDFGESFTSRAGLKRSVWGIIEPRLLNTGFLAVATAAISIPIALILGLMTARFRDSYFDRSVNSVNLAAISMPEFVLAYGLVMFLAIKFPIFPALSNVTPEMPIGEKLYRSALPIITLSLVMTAHIMRMTRAAIVGVLASPYIEMASLKGIPPRRVIYHHALANSWGPIVNVIAFNLAYLVVGVVVLETVFVYPGLGQAMVDAIRTRDIPVVQACALIFAVIYIGFNLMADVVSIATNPRLLYKR